MIDSFAGGLLSELPVEECKKIIAMRASHDEQYNPDMGTKVKNSMLIYLRTLCPKYKDL
jgi:hypothetical protein